MERGVQTRIVLLSGKIRFELNPTLVVILGLF